MIQIGNETFLTSQQVCKRAGVEEWRLNYLARQGIIAPVAVIPGRRLWDVSAVAKLAAFYENRGAGREMVRGVKTAELAQPTKQ